MIPPALPPAHDPMASNLPMSIHGSSVKGWKGDEASPGKPKYTSIDENGKLKYRLGTQPYYSEDDGADGGSEKSEMSQHDENELDDLSVLMQNKQLKSMIDGKKENKQLQNTENTENLKMILKTETANNQITLQMTRQKLLSIIDELLGKRLDSILEHSNAYKGIQGNQRDIKTSSFKDNVTALMSSQLSD